MRRLLLLCVCLLPQLAVASPWTLPQGTLVVSGRYDFEAADREFLDDSGDDVPYSLRGGYQASTFTVGARFGLTDRLEFELAVPLRQVAYTADPVILLPRDPASEVGELDYHQENIIDLSQKVQGIADLKFAVRYRLWLAQTVGALQLEVVTPTGYQGPQGTFGDRPNSIATFVSDLPRFVRPENVADDVTLGDGVLQIKPAFLFGWGFATGTFMRLDLGYNLRLNGAGDLLSGALRAGQLLGRHVLVYAGVEGEYTVEDGRVIGVSVAAEDPTLPAAEYGGTNNLALREVTLDRDRLVIPAGLIIRVTPEAELNFGYATTVWGRNTAKVHSASVGLAVRTQAL